MLKIQIESNDKARSMGVKRGISIALTEKCVYINRLKRDVPGVQSADIKSPMLVPGFKNLRYPGVFTLVRR